MNNIDWKPLTTDSKYLRAVQDLRWAEDEKRKAEAKEYLAWKKVNEMEEAFKNRNYMMSELDRLIEKQKHE